MKGIATQHIKKSPEDAEPCKYEGFENNKAKQRKAWHVCDRVYMKTRRRHQKLTLPNATEIQKRSTKPRFFLIWDRGDLVLHGTGYDSDKYGSSSPFRRLERQVLDSKWRLTASARTVKYRVTKRTPTNTIITYLEEASRKFCKGSRVSPFPGLPRKTPCASEGR